MSTRALVRLRTHILSSSGHCSRFPAPPHFYMRASRDRKGGWNDDDDDFVSRSANPNAPPPADDDDDDDFAQLRKEKKEAPKSDGTRHTERRRMNL